MVEIGNIGKKVVDHRDLPKSRYPWLIHRIMGEEKHEQTLHNILQDDPFTLESPYLQHKYVWSFSCHEWWVVQDCISNDDQCFLLNPITMERIELPNMDKTFKISVCILSDSPQNPDCKILFCSSKSALFCRIGCKEFNEQVLAEEDELFTSAAVVCGTIYGLLGCYYTQKLVSINFEGESLEIVKVIDDDYDVCIWSHIGTFCTKDCLIESNDELFHLHASISTSFWYETADFMIRKFNPSCLEWEILESIGDDRAIFFDGFSGKMCCNVDKEMGIKGNCIYYVRELSNHINIFYLEDGSISSSTLSPSTVEANYTKHGFCWIRLP